MEQSKIAEERNERELLKKQIAEYEAALRKIISTAECSLKTPDFAVGYMKGIAQEALSTRL